MLSRVISLISKQRVYHKDGCPYVSKISDKFKKFVDVEKREFKKYRPCKYCGGMRGYARIFHKRPSRRKYEKGINCWYDDRTGYIFMKTNIGFWKVYWKPSTSRLLLFHRNGENENKSNRELMNGKFHRQTDVGPTDNFDSLVSYISSHDRNKEIASKDYRRLPRKTKQQKRIYNHYRKKANRNYRKHMDKLFESIAKEKARK